MTTPGKTPLTDAFQAAQAKEYKDESALPNEIRIYNLACKHSKELWAHARSLELQLVAHKRALEVAVGESERIGQAIGRLYTMAAHAEKHVLAPPLQKTLIGCVLDEYLQVVKPALRRIQAVKEQNND